MKCTKKRDTRAKVVFMLISADPLLYVFAVLIAVAVIVA